MAPASQRKNGVILGGVGCLVAASAWIVGNWLSSRQRGDNDGGGYDGPTGPATAHEQLIEAGTPLVELKRVKQLIGRSIFVKMESMNPGGTGKDRAALNMIRVAEKEGMLPPPAAVPTQQRTYSDDSLFLHPSVPMFSSGRMDRNDGDHNDGDHNDGDHNDNDNDNDNDIGNAATQQQQQQQQGQHTHDGASAVAPAANSTEEELESMVLRAVRRSRTGGLVVEGTSGSTGIALATLCAARGHACLVVLPDDQAVEKQRILRSLGAVVYEVPTAAISNPKHYVNLGRKAAAMARDRFGVPAFFVDQFENLSNFDIHYRKTGPELVRQLEEKGVRGGPDAFVMSSGTGGTIAGIATYLKEHGRECGHGHDRDRVTIVLVDPPGSALYHKVEHGVAFAVEQRERYLRKHRYDTLAEGIGLDRITRNFASGLPRIERSVRVTDQEAVDMAHWMLRTEGLWIGSSSAMNLVGAVRTALELPEGSSVVTMVCDGGQRHATRFWNPSFVREWGLEWPGADRVPECLKRGAHAMGCAE